MLVGIQAHRIHCYIGILPEEREKEQDIFVDIEVRLTPKPDCAWDSVDQTVNYVKLAHTCTYMAQNNRYGLLEKMAEEILKQFMLDFPIDWAWIRIKKPGAISSANYAFVELERYAERS